MRWIALLLLFTGCAAPRISRVSAGLCNGQPMVQVDFAVDKHETVPTH